MAINNRFHIGNLIKKKDRFFKFLLVGLGSTAIDFILFYFLNIYIGFGIVISNIVSYGTGITSSFFINRKWTFADSKRKSKKLLLLSLTLGYTGLIINTIIVLILSYIFHVMVAKSIAVILIVIYNYITNKYIVFRV